MIKFGDVFKHGERDYVYLAGTSEIIYAAKILSIENTEKVLNLSNKRETNGNRDKYKGHSLYCFVMLDTDEFKDRMAHFQQTQYGDVSVESAFRHLNTGDLKKIKEEIKKK